MAQCYTAENDHVFHVYFFTMVTARKTLQDLSVSRGVMCMHAVVGKSCAICPQVSQAQCIKTTNVMLLQQLEFNLKVCMETQWFLFKLKIMMFSLNELTQPDTIANTVVCQLLSWILSDSGMFCAFVFPMLKRSTCSGGTQWKEETLPLEAHFICCFHTLSLDSL